MLISYELNIYSGFRFYSFKWCTFQLVWWCIFQLVYTFNSLFALCIVPNVLKIDIIFTPIF